MAFAVLIAATIAALIGYSPAPVMAVGALILAGMAYHMTRHRSLLRMALVFAFFVAGHFYVSHILRSTLHDVVSTEIEVLRLIASDVLLVALSGAVMLISVMAGVYGPYRNAEVRKFFRHLRDDDTA